MKNPSLKLIVALLGLPLFVALADLAWTQGPLYKSRTNGAQAYYNIQESFSESEGTFSGYANRSAYVEISEADGMATGGISGHYFNLYFEVSLSKIEGSGYLYGSGPISDQYVTFDKPENHNLSLNVDTSLLPYPFYLYQSGNLVIQPPVIQLRWTRSNNDWQRWEGHHIQEMGNLIQHSQGSGVYYFTIPTGTITLPPVDLPLLWTYMYGYMGTQRSSNWLVQRGPTK